MRGLRSVFRTSAGNRRKLIALVFVKDVLTVLVQLHLDGGAEKIDLDGRSVTVLGLDEGTLLRNLLDQVFIGFLLIPQAAHQTAAAAGDFGGIEGKGLNFCHLGGDGMKVVQKLIAAVGTAADSQASQHFRFVPNPDLPQLDPIVQDSGQVLDQRTEIHPSVRSKKEGGLAAFKIALDIDQLHIQAVLLNLLTADLKRAFLPLAIEFLGAEIHLGSDAQNTAQRLDNGGILHRVIFPGAYGDFHTVGGVDDDAVADLNLKAGRVEIIRLSAVFESDANYFGHVFSPILCTVSAGMCPGGPGRASAASRLNICLAFTFTFRWSEHRCRRR